MVGLPQNGRAWLEINLSDLKNNIIEIREQITQNRRLMAVVKANAYGCGANAVAETLSEYIECFGVATDTEALSLRENGIENDIVILGAVHEQSIGKMLQSGICLNAYSLEFAEKISSEAKDENINADVYISINTGMNRMGIECNEKGIKEVKKILKLPYINIKGIFTHYTSAEGDNEITLKQREDLYAFFKKIRKIKNINISISNTAGAIKSADEAQEVRVGIGLYGIMPSEEMENIGLKPIMSVKSRVLRIKTVPEGTAVGYGGTYVTKGKTKIATIGIGYADGLPRSLSNNGYVLINGKRANIIGKISMDQTTVDVTDIEDVKINSAATVLGKDGKEEITAWEIANMAKTIPYEIMCSFDRARVNKIYKYNE